tara:strand:- start:1309 stop:1998 length:690 start_codon:yes stop_codon:yes gene_type:complete
MQNYFSDAQNFANENYSNYDGWDNMSEDPYNYMDDNYDYASQGIGAEAKASLPFILNIANSTTDDVSDVVFLGSNSNLFGAANEGNLAAITITMDNGNVTYIEFLESIKSEPFKVGLMYLQSANTSQPFKQLVINYREPNGREVTLPVSPALDPMQQQGGVTIVRHKFPVNAFTKITTTILASATLTVRLYPMEQLDMSRGLSGRSVGKNYSRPNLSQFQFPTRQPLVS